MTSLKQQDTSKHSSIPRVRSHFVGLGLTEVSERFAFAGVKSMLTLLLISTVLLPDANVAGLAWLEKIFERSAEQHAVSFASLIYGLSSALVYLCIPAGGLLGDLLIGRRASVLTGGACVIAGLLLMISLQGFLLGLLLFAAGTGLLKSNLSVQFGALFADEDLRRRSYSYYLAFLNAGVICGPLLMGAVALTSGWRSALATAVGVVAIGLTIYMRLLTHVPDRPVRTLRAEIAGESVIPEGGSSGGIPLFAAAMLAVYLCFAAYGQIGNIVLVWTQQRVDLNVGQWTLPPGWILALDGAFTILLVFASQALFRALRRRGLAISALTQIMLGCLCCAGGYLVLVLAEWIGQATLSLGWVVGYLLLVDLGIVLVWPSGLSLATELAPRRRTGMWAGLFYLHGFFASLWVGFAGGLFETVEAGAFWWLHAVLAFAGAAVALLAAAKVRQASQAITTSA